MPKDDDTRIHQPAIVHSSGCDHKYVALPTGTIQHAHEKNFCLNPSKDGRVLVYSRGCANRAENTWSQPDNLRGAVQLNSDHQSW